MENIVVTVHPPTETKPKRTTVKSETRGTVADIPWNHDHEGQEQAVYAIGMAYGADLLKGRNLRFLRETANGYQFGINP